MTAALMLSAASRSSGKTMVAAGLARAFARRGLAVQAFKKGPDFIDPQWLSAACARAARNLDPRLQGEQGASEYAWRHAAGADLVLVEGSQGLHDGLEPDGSDSNAGLAKRLGVPVVLVMDARGMGRTAGAVALGLATFDPALHVAGVILNRVASRGHEARLRAAVERAGLAVLGAIGEDARMALAERHLGLVPASESPQAEGVVARLADAVSQAVDLDAVLAAAGRAADWPAAALPDAAPVVPCGPRIGIARDRAFGFYYPDDLDALRASGATLVPFDALADPRLPAVDGLFLGGGFPELFAAPLEANESLREDVRLAVAAGMPVHAECGGLMYLARSLVHGGRRYRMAGALPVDVAMQPKPVGKGYVTLAATAEHPWCGSGEVVQAHEFHHSRVEDADSSLRYAWRVVRGHGIDGARDGIVHRNVLASYAHLRSVGGNDWAARFVAHVRGGPALTRAAA